MAVNAIITKAQEKSHKILTENVDSLHAIANYLLKKETITGAEFMEILEKNRGEEKAEVVAPETPKEEEGEEDLR